MGTEAMCLYMYTYVYIHVYISGVAVRMETGVVWIRGTEAFGVCCMDVGKCCVITKKH